MNNLSDPEGSGEAGVSQIMKQNDLLNTLIFSSQPFCRIININAIYFSIAEWKYAAFGGWLLCFKSAECFVEMKGAKFVSLI